MSAIAKAIEVDGVRKQQFNRRRRLRGWVVVVLVLTLVVGGALAVAKRSGAIRSYYSQLRYKPASGNDFSLLKINYYDLYRLDSSKFHLAGAPIFPIDTDSLSPVSSGTINSLEELVQKELVNHLAYSQRPQESENVQTRKLIISTNTLVRLSQSETRDRIKRIVLKSADGSRLNNVDLSIVSTPEADTPMSDASNLSSQVERALYLFQLFTKYKRNATSPHGSSYALTFDQLRDVYGYGQCENLSYALSDLFYRHSIKSHLIYLQNPVHTLVEAHMDNGARAVFDPFLNVAFVNPATMASLGFDQVKADVSGALVEFVGDEQKRTEAQEWYRGKVTAIKKLIPTAPTKRSFDLLPGEAVEYEFLRRYPWIAQRNISPPPDEVIGSFKKHFHIGPDSLNNSAKNTVSLKAAMPYPIVDTEIVGLSSRNRPDILINTGTMEKIEYDQSWKFVSLRRYIQTFPVEEETDGVRQFQRTMELTFRYNDILSPTDPGFNVSVVSQISLLPYYYFMDGFVKVNADENRPVLLTITY